MLRLESPCSPLLHPDPKSPFYPCGPKHSHEPVETSKPLYQKGRSSRLLSHDSPKRKCPAITENESDGDNRHFSCLLAGFF
jgi:hypothetical protein